MRIIKDFIPVGSGNRSGIIIKPKYFNVHETGNFAVGANAKMHSIYIKSKGAQDRQVSWTWTVDSGEDIYQHLPSYPAEVGWQAGDGRGPGNMECLSLEMCVNIDGDYEQTLKNAIWLIRDTFKTHPDLIIRLVRDSVKQHNHWSGKDCPQRLRASGRWGWFVSECEKIGEVEVIDMAITQNSKVKIKSTATRYMTGELIPSENKGKEYIVSKLGHPWNVPGDGALLSVINSYVWLKDLELSVPPVVVTPPATVLKSVYDKAVADLNAVKSQLTTANSSLAKSNAELSTTKTNLSKALATISTLQGDLINKDNEINIEKQNTIKANARANVAEINLKDLEAEFRELQDNFTELTNSHAEIVAEKEVLTAHHNDQMAVLKIKNELAIKEKLAEINLLNARVAELEKEIVVTPEEPPIIIDWKDASWKQLLKQAIINWWKSE